MVKPYRARKPSSKCFQIELPLLISNVLSRRVRVVSSELDVLLPQPFSTSVPKHFVLKPFSPSPQNPSNPSGSAFGLGVYPPDQTSLAKSWASSSQVKSAVVKKAFSFS